MGATLIHIVDLDGAFSGSQKNIDSIIRIRQAVGAKLQLGGGIRDLKTIERLFGLGIDRVILGTVAIENPSIVEEASREFPDRILVGIDAKNSLVAVKGWVEVSGIRAVELAKKMEGLGAAGIIYTDIARDGMLSGPNIGATQEIVSSVSIPVIASGGVSSIEDIKRLKEIKGLWGAITGKAIYTGLLNLKEAIELCLQKE